MERRGFVILALLSLIVACTPTPTPTPPVMMMTRAPVITQVAFVKLVSQASKTATVTATPTVEPSARPSPTLVASTPPTAARMRTPRPGQTVWRGDLHMHTTCSDGQNTYEEMAQSAIQRHLDFIAITDHVGHAERDCHNEAVIKCLAETRLLCIPGAELTAKLHLLAIGIQQRIDPKLTLSAWVTEIHRQGGLAIAAHPYDKRWPYTAAQLFHSNLEAMECARGTADENRQQWLLSDQYNLPCVYNSDAHYQQDVGWRHNVCSVPINSLADLRAALIGKKCKMN